MFVFWVVEMSSQNDAAASDAGSVDDDGSTISHDELILLDLIKTHTGVHKVNLVVHSG